MQRGFDATRFVARTQHSGVAPVFRVQVSAVTAVSADDALDHHLVDTPIVDGDALEHGTARATSAHPAGGLLHVAATMDMAGTRSYSRKQRKEALGRTGSLRPPASPRPLAVRE
jgi:hypothetical protein